MAIYVDENEKLIIINYRTTNNYLITSSNETISDGKWHHAVAVHIAMVLKPKLYLDNLPTDSY